MFWHFVLLAQWHSTSMEVERQKGVELHPGLGNYHHPITTKSAEAQTYFNQGLTLLYGFNHDEAARYFRHASELDPEAAMPYWGLALSIGPNYNDTAIDEARAKTTYDAVQKALQRAPKASVREQDYVRALAKRYRSPNPKSNWKQLHLDYSKAMRELAKKYPDDLDATTMFAESLMMLRPWQLWTLDGKPAPGTLELVAVLESVLKRNPDHPGANHFYIHAVEASSNLERAIPSAVRLMTLVPGAGHLVHMPGHIFLQTGDYDLAAKTNVNAAAADKAFVERTGAAGVYPLMYWTHNIHFISYARAQQGRYDEARQAAQEMARHVGDADLKMQMLEGFHLYPLMVDLRFHRWDDILSTAIPALIGTSTAPSGSMRAQWRWPGRASSPRRWWSKSSLSRSAKRCHRNRNSSSTINHLIFLPSPRPLSTRSLPGRAAKKNSLLKRGAGRSSSSPRSIMTSHRRGSTRCGNRWPPLSCAAGGLERRNPSSARRSESNRATAGCSSACGRV